LIKDATKSLDFESFGKIAASGVFGLYITDKLVRANSEFGSFPAHVVVSEGNLRDGKIILPMK
jgi:hypothetical protein